MLMNRGSFEDAEDSFCLKRNFVGYKLLLKGVSSGKEFGYSDHPTPEQLM